MDSFKSLFSPLFPVTIIVSELKKRLFFLFSDNGRVSFRARHGNITMKSAFEKAVAAQKVDLSKWMLLPWLTTVGPADALIDDLAARVEPVFREAFSSFTPAPLPKTGGQEAHLIREAQRFAQFLSGSPATISHGQHDLVWNCSVLYQQYKFSALLRFLLFDGCNQHVAVSAAQNVEAAGTLQ